MTLIEKLLDLQKQATTERSHYYVASCLTEAIQEIVALRETAEWVITEYKTKTPNDLGKAIAELEALLK